jgi:hypothetical protein
VQYCGGKGLGELAEKLGFEISGFEERGFTFNLREDNSRV